MTKTGAEKGEYLNSQEKKERKEREKRKREERGEWKRESTERREKGDKNKCSWRLKRELKKRNILELTD